MSDELAGFQTPEWAKHVVFYQIFPERFANGDPANDPENVQPRGSRLQVANYYQTADTRPHDRSQALAFQRVNATRSMPHMYVELVYMGGDLSGVIDTLPANYACWWGFRSLPKFNTDHPPMRVYAFGRWDARELLIVALTSQGSPRTLDLPARGLPLPAGAPLTDLLSGSRYYAGAERVEGVLLPAYGGAVLHTALQSP